VSLMAAAAMLAICLLALVETTNTAEADDSLPQNGKIAFTSFRNGDVEATSDVEATIYAVEPDGSNRSQLTNGGYPNWSPDGTELSFVRMKERYVSVISVMSADGSNLRDLNTIEEFNGEPTWLPDGTKLAFSDYRISEDIYTIDLASSRQTNLTKTLKFDEQYPDFSPKGSQICFFRSARGKSAPGIYVMDADGSDPTLLFEYYVSSWEQCDWSPDGKKVALPASGSAFAGDVEIYVINADGSGWTALTRNSAVDRQPAWSPDGTRIAFASDRDGDFEIYTMDADGSDIVQVTKNSGVDDIDPNWQPLPGTTVDQPDTGGPSLLLVASVLLFSGGVMFYAGLKRRV
jgi:Tol biopolymer transport system component